jgi:hypothetical protein
MLMQHGERYIGIEVCIGRFRYEKNILTIDLMQ